MANIQQFYKETTQAITAYVQQELKLTYGYHYSITRVANGPRVIGLSINVNPRYFNKIKELSLEMSMAAQLDKQYTVGVGRGRRGSVVIEVPKPKEFWRTIRLADLPKRRHVKLPTGIDSEEYPVCIDFNTPTHAHCLVAGATGSGKSNALSLIFSRLAFQNDPSAVKFILIDTEKQGMAWDNFRTVPHLLHPIVTDREEAAKVLMWACAEIELRAAQRRKTPRIVIGWDEVQGGLEARPDLIKVLSRLVSLGRELGVHIVIATQHPTVETLGSSAIKANVQVRLVGKVSSGTAALAATNVPQTNAEKLLGDGDMILVAGEVSRIATAYVSSEELSDLPKTDRVPSLDLSMYEDSEQVASKADAITPEQAALALVKDCGITKLSKELSIGTAKARRVQDFAREMQGKLREMGYTTMPLDQSRKYALSEKSLAPSYTDELE